MDVNAILERACSRKAREIHGHGTRVLEVNNRTALVEVQPRYSVDKPYTVAHAIDLKADGRLSFGEARPMNADEVLAFTEGTAPIDDGLEAAAERIAEAEGLDMSDYTDRERCLVLAMEQAPGIKPSHLYGPHAQMVREAGGAGPFKAMGHICKRDGHRSLTSDWYAIRRKLFREQPEWAPTIDSATSLDECIEAVLLSEDSRLSSVVPEHHAIAAERAALLRPDLLEAAYPRRDEDTDTQDERLDATEEARLDAQLNAGERVIRLAESELQRRGLDCTDYTLVSNEVERLVANNPSLTGGESYGAPER